MLLMQYKSIYEHHQKDADGNVIPHEEKEELNEGKMPEGLKNYLMKKKGKKEDKKDDMKEGMVGMAAKALGGPVVNKALEVANKMKEKPTPTKKPMIQSSYDLFDLVKGKLIDEGVDEKEALKIMVNATEEQLQQIVEMDKMGGPAAIAGIMGAGILGAKKMVQGVNNMRKNLQQKTQQKNKAIEQM